MRPRILAIAAITAAALLLPLSSARAAKIKVHAGESIQTAIDGAGAGDTILVFQGTYRENLVIPDTKTGLILRGKGSTPSKVIVDARPGAPDSTGPGILILAAAVSVENLTVRHAHADEPPTVSGHGIEIIAENVHLTNVSVTRAQVDGVNVVGADFRADRCSIVGCGGWGINVVSGKSADIWDGSVSQCALGGIKVSSGKADVFRNTVTLIKDGEGIKVNGNNAEVFKNVVRATGQELIQIIGDDALITKNKLSASADDGIKVDGSDFEIANNKIEQLLKSGDGIRILNATAGTIHNNQIMLTAEAGIEVTASSMVVISDNTLTDCGSALIPSIHVFQVVSLISILGNTVTRGQGDGIHVDGDNNVVDNNFVKDCLEDGIDVEAGTGNKVRFNKIRGCSAEGFENNAAATVVRGNNSKKNRLDFANDGTLATEQDNVYGSGGPGVAPEIDD